MSFSLMNTDLDIRICDLEEEAENTETYREFIRNSEKIFGLRQENIDQMDEQNLNDYLNFLCDMWDK